MTTLKERAAWWLAVLVTAATAATAVTLQSGSFLIGSVTGSASGTRAAPCLPGREIPVMDSPHIAESQIAAVRYNSVPPTSGPHFSFTVAPGIYPDPVPDGLAVHALEHGHIVIRYGDGTSPQAVDRLRRLSKQYGRDVVLAPYPSMGSVVALTAWGRLAEVPADLDDAREREIVDFVEGLRNRYVHTWTRADDCPPSG
ncbi:DUF3105 domain-containing protein [Actinoplanes sp. NPDC051859]|uniref:DUF3105 domain-containing protein n=1 Tax=Actinoplanes sp. NPDC051859 TaxID=3363909 RepID=UPI00379C1E0D